MSQIDLSDKFPNLEPIHGAPSLWTVNGCGVSLYGVRDRDEETETFVKTRCLCLLFIPIFAFGAYRVAKADHSSWYFIGREPLSAIAKSWNLVAALLIGGGISFAVWNSYYNSPNAVAARQLAEADSLVSDGQIVKAAQLYRSVIYGDSNRSEEGRDRLVKMHEQANVRSAELEEVAQVLAVELSSRRQSAGDPVGHAVFEAGMSMVEERAESDLPGANAILEVLEPVAVDEQRYTALRHAILEQLVKAEPDDIDLASQFAATLEAEGELERCEALLVPHVDQLGTSEGARILGQIWAIQGKLDEAHDLLLPYCEQRLEALRRVEAAYSHAYESAQRRVLKGLENGSAPASFYSRYESSPEAEQMQMVQEYVAGKLENNQAIDEARQAYIAETDVVPVALDLGMVKLRRAQAMPDAQQQRAELEQAEETFKSIRGVAGESDQYRLYMGQVNYWLGKFDEGRQLFDDLLEANNRDFEVLVTVGSMVREVGRVAEARKLIEEAYETAPEETQKHTAASMRAAMMQDIEDRIQWLERANMQNPQTKAAYSSAKGQQAYADGDFEQAAELLRQAIKAYDENTETVAMLNNSGLTCVSLYRVTGDEADFAEGQRRIEKAISLAPTDSILRFNASHVFATAAYADVAGEAIDFGVLKSDPSAESLSYLYDNRQEKAAVIRKIQEHRGMKKSIDLLQNVIMLAPKNTDAYDALATIYQFTRDLGAARDLYERVVAAQPEPDLGETLSFYAGEKDDKYRHRFEANLDRLVQSVQRSEDGTVTHASAVGTLADMRIASSTVQELGDLNELVRMTAAAYRDAPSVGTRWALTNLLLARAHQALVAENDEFRQLAERARHTLSPSRVVALAAAEGGALSEEVLRHPDVVRALKLIHKSLAYLPAEIRPFHWAMFRYHDPPLADKIAKGMIKNELDNIVRDLRTYTSPANVSNALEVYWLKLAQGQPDQAREALLRCAQHGAPLPFDVE